MTPDIIIKGKALYTTKGAALEYGRIGCNFYTGCPHEGAYEAFLSHTVDMDGKRIQHDYAIILIIINKTSETYESSMHKKSQTERIAV